MNKKIKQTTKKRIRLSLELSQKSLYKALEFQLLFKVFYIGIFIFIINFLINTVVDITDMIIEKMRIGEAFGDTLITSIFDFNLIFMLTSSLLAVIYIYLIEKNGVIIITSEYYKNHFISFFRTFLVAMKKTPLLLFRKLRELKKHILIFILLYILWKVLAIFSVPIFIMTGLSIILVLYCIGIVFALLFHQTFTAHITCLEPNESYREFEKNKSYESLHEVIYAPFIFYVTLFIAILLWLLMFYIITQILLHVTFLNSEITSYIIAYFISFSIISILIILSLFKTIRISLLTILYFEERKRQNKQVHISTTTQQPVLSKNIYKAIGTIMAILLIGSVLLTTTIKQKTDTIRSNAHIYMQEVRNNNTFQNMSIEDIDLQYILEETTTNNSTTLRTIEEIIFTIFAYIIK